MIFASSATDSCSTTPQESPLQTSTIASATQSSPISRNLLFLVFDGASRFRRCSRAPCSSFSPVSSVTEFNSNLQTLLVPDHSNRLHDSGRRDEKKDLHVERQQLNRLRGQHYRCQKHPNQRSHAGRHCDPIGRCRTRAILRINQRAPPQRSSLDARLESASIHPTHRSALKQRPVERSPRICTGTLRQLQKTKKGKNLELHYINSWGRSCQLKD